MSTKGRCTTRNSKGAPCDGLRTRAGVVKMTHALACTTGTQEEWHETHDVHGDAGAWSSGDKEVWVATHRLEVVALLIELQFIEQRVPRRVHDRHVGMI